MRVEKTEPKPPMNYLTALRLSWATHFYGRIIQLFMQEKHMRDISVLRAAECKPSKVLETGCGTGA